MTDPAQNSSALQESGDSSEEKFSDSESPDGAATCHGGDDDTWIEIELYDEEGNPCANEPYTITLPDETIVSGNLDSNGFARHEDLTPGTCHIKFPNRDPFDPRDNPKDWIELLVMDEDRQPAADEKYLIVLPDGEQKSGSLDKDGKVKLEKVAPGFFRLYFPDHPHYKWEVY